MGKIEKEYRRVYLSLPSEGDFNGAVEAIKASFGNAEIVTPSHEEAEEKEPLPYADEMRRRDGLMGQCDAVAFGKNWDMDKKCIHEKVMANTKGIDKFYLTEDGGVSDSYVRWRPKERPRTCYSLFGVECGEGWKKLYQPIIDEVNAYNEDKDEDSRIEITQIKEKFGGLRVYLSRYTDKLDKMIEDAEEESLSTCEYCGAPGKTRNNGWIYTLCDDCWNDTYGKKEGTN